jgi:methyl-accepting chemotaxis protein
MRFLSSFRLKTKLYLMIAIPLVAMLYFSIDSLLDQDYKHEEMEKLVEMSQLASHLSALIHETQKERGSSAGFIGSKGQKFADILPKQRDLTDQRSKALNELLSTIDISQHGTIIEQRLNALLSELQQISSIRQQVSRLALPLPQVVSWYTQMNTKLLAVVEQMPHGISDAKLVATISAYVNYLQSKERVGIERAVLSATFSSNQFAPGMYKKFIELVTAQKNFLHVFKTLASEKSQQFYQKTMRHESVETVEQMRKVAFEKAQSGGFGIEAEHWFKTMTFKINQLKKVDDYLGQDILNESKTMLDHTALVTRIYLFLIVVLFSVTVFIAYQVSTTVRLSVIRIREAIQEVVNEGTLSRRTEVLTQDGIGDIATSFNTLLEKLQVSISETNKVVAGVAQGVYTDRVTADLKGDLLTLKEGVNGSADSVQKTMGGLKEVMDAISNGRFDYRLDGVEMEEEFQLSLINAMESMERIINDVNQVMSAVSIGKFDARVTETAYGDLDTLKQNLNQSLEALGGALKETVQVANRMGEGDLTRQIEGSYQGALGVLKDSINATETNFEQIVAKVRSVAELVRSGSDEISKGSMDLSSRTSEQAASLEETAASMEQMASTVNMNADNAAQANQLAAESVRRAKEGGIVVADTVKAMEGINESSNKIAEIISLIDGIAFQTNLLALNAAVEAARAGEHGRGFAVVAGEVRTLAQRSADAAKDIKGLIEDTTSRIEQGAELVGRSGEALEAIEESVKKMNDISGEIAASTKEQTQGIDQVNLAVTQLDSATQENAALVEESAASSSQLSHQADELSKVVSIFKLSPSALSSMAKIGTAQGEYADTFMKARSAHLAWRGKIRGFLDGVIEMDQKSAVSHHECMLGQWLDWEGREKFAYLSEMKEMDQVHEKMHTTISEIVTLKKSGNEQEAEQRFNEIEPLSKQVVDLLNKIESAAFNDSPESVPVASSTTAAPATIRKPAAEAKPSLVSAKSSSDSEWEEF